MKRRVVITGMGGISPIGNTSAEIWKNAAAGVCGIGRITAFDASDHKVSVAGEVRGFDPLEFMDKMTARRTARFTQFARVTAREAFSQSGLDMSRENPDRCGVCVSSGIGGLGVIEEEHYRGIEKGFDRVSPLFVPMAITNMAAGTVAIELGFHGSCTATVTACASATNAIGEAFRQIRDGYAEVMAAGGAESCISPLGIGGFTAMRALSESQDPQRASIPFDKERGGFVMGEGAAVLILEEYQHALERGAAILGEVAGYGASCDAHHMTAPLEDGTFAARCMENALADGGVTPSEVGYINAHGTGTPMNDVCETRAVKIVFGTDRSDLLMSSTKSMTGHLLGASGAVEALITAWALQEQTAPPTIGYKVADPACDLNIVPGKAQPLDTEYALSNSLGFGGHNASLLLRRV
jgi:3-oxoacyl-[acyl-carrier-protein] synthase II